MTLLGASGVLIHGRTALAGSRALSGLGDAPWRKRLVAVAIRAIHRIFGRYGSNLL
jgi:hypothetical protein